MFQTHGVGEMAVYSVYGNQTITSGSKVTRPSDIRVHTPIRLA